MSDDTEDRERELVPDLIKPQKFKGKDFSQPGRSTDYKRQMARVANVILRNPALSFSQACKLCKLTDKQIWRLRRHGDFMSILRARVAHMRETAVTTAQRVATESDGRTAMLAVRALWDMSNDIAPLQVEQESKASHGPVTVNVGVLVQRLSETTMGKALLEVESDVRTSTVVSKPQPIRYDSPYMPHNHSYEAIPTAEEEESPDPGRDILDELLSIQATGGGDGQAGGGRDDT